MATPQSKAVLVLMRQRGYQGRVGSGSRRHQQDRSSTMVGGLLYGHLELSGGRTSCSPTVAHRSSMEVGAVMVAATLLHHRRRARGLDGRERSPKVRKVRVGTTFFSNLLSQLR